MKKPLNLLVIIALAFVVSCSNSDDDGGGSTVDCSQALVNINTARTAFEEEANEITCTVLKNALAVYLDNCPANLFLQDELDNLPDCSATGEN